MMSADGKLLVYQRVHAQTNVDVFTLAVDGSQTQTLVVASPANESQAILLRTV